MHHVLNVDDLKQDDIEVIFDRVPAMERGATDKYSTPNCNKIMATLFFEPSTRTKLSFQSAMYKLGGKVIDLPINSSQKKGETDIDTVKTTAEYADVIVIRHPEAIMEELAAASSKPVISAGEASFNHPTQALLDLYTIRQHSKNKKSVTVMFTGDLYYSRTVPSLVALLKKEEYSVKFIFTNKVNPSLIDHNDPAMNYFDESFITIGLNSVDVLYMTRPQKERWMNGGRLPEGEPSSFILTKNLARTMRPDGIIMHPLPRNEEIHPDVDELPQAKYFEQVKNGLYIRMALLEHLLWK
jgi:aspartate carbamoyltransferase catalytic subunit